MNTLKLEKRGCDFNPFDSSVFSSDIGNYRVCTGDYTVRAKNGKTYFLEFTHFDKYRYRSTHKRTGKPLKHPVRELVAACVAHVDACYIAEDGFCYGDIAVWRDCFDTPRPYTVAGILDIVNSIAAVPYDGIEFV